MNTLNLCLDFRQKMEAWGTFCYLSEFVIIAAKLILCKVMVFGHVWASININLTSGYLAIFFCPYVPVIPLGNLLS